MHVYKNNILRLHGSNNSKVQGVVSILKTWEQVCYLVVFCFKAIVMLTNMYA